MLSGGGCIGRSSSASPRCPTSRADAEEEGPHALGAQRVREDVDDALADDDEFEPDDDDDADLDFDADDAELSSDEAPGAAAASHSPGATCTQSRARR